ncbi:uncharacterized protein [Antedon mediterranea]|uniref:uncharacterized protein n=1 Tax=Antedon mediterranea TaxID=105859 RepID=UPI003AF4FBE6
MYLSIVISCFELWFLLVFDGIGSCLSTVPPRPSYPPRYITYSREELIQLRPALPGVQRRSRPSATDTDTLGAQIKNRKRGRRGGLKARLKRRKFSAPLPSILTGNAQSLRNKLDELKACTLYLKDYRDANLICMSETWFTDTDSEFDTNIDGFSCERSDRTLDSGKSIGGGVCVFVNSLWCNNVTVKYRRCTTNYELITVSLRPFYFPREFNNIFVTVVYIHPRADMKVAASDIQTILSELDTESPDAVKLVTGDFNSCDLKKVSNYYQYVDFPTRGDKILDCCYGNIKNAYKSSPKAGLGKSDHKMIHLIPAYKQKLKQSKPMVKEIKVWTNDSMEEFKGCLEATNWDVFMNTDSIDATMETIVEYINFCESSIIKKKEIKIYPNSKPWVTKDIRELLQQKQQAVRNNDVMEKKRIQKLMKKRINDAKRKFGEKIKNDFDSGNPKQAWNGLKKVIGNAKRQNTTIVPSGSRPLDFANKLNIFFNRFDNDDQINNTNDNDVKLNLELNTTKSDVPEFDLLSVEKVFKGVKPNKAAGSDKLTGNILKSCYKQLAPIFCRLFNWSLSSSCVPCMWKYSIIAPINKVPKPKILNDYRPVALTQIITKCFERLFKDVLIKETLPFVDNNQFAYCSNRGVDDAITTLLHPIYETLDKPRQYVRTLFLDFSSAFNSMKPNILLDKLVSMNVNPFVCLWIRDFLKNRTQRVRIDNVLSDIIVSNTGAPQGCVLSPLLFTLYTSDLRSESCQIVKFADDTCITGLIVNNDESTYRTEVNNIINWCDMNCLSINVNKTKEIVFDFRKIKRQLIPLNIKDNDVRTTSEHKYLGVWIDEKLSWNANTAKVYAKANQRLYFLRKLRNFKIGRDALSLFHQAMIQSILTFCCIVWLNSLSKNNSNKLQRIIKMAKKVIGANVPSIHDICDKVMEKKLKCIINDQSHPLFNFINFSRSGRMIPSIKKTERHNKSFLPCAIKQYNKQFKR